MKIFIRIAGKSKIIRKPPITGAELHAANARVSVVIDFFAAT